MNLKQSKLILGLICITIAAKAQDPMVQVPPAAPVAAVVPVTPPLLSKKGEVILPEAKDWALSVDGTPFLSYMGKLLSNLGSDAPGVNSLSNFPLTIGGKYFITDKQAYRARVRIGLMSQSVSNSVVDDVNTTIDTLYIKDTKKTSATNISLAFGKEFRRGRTRLQGFCGFEGILGITTGSTNYNYGNQYTNLNTSATTTDFETTTALGYASGAANSRVKQDKSGTGIRIGARGFIGAEYFIFPKLSLGFEFGWSIMYSNVNDGSVSVESFDNINNSVKNKALAKSGKSGFGVDNDNSGGSMLLSFHF